jgi:hypothetical protein
MPFLRQEPDNTLAETLGNLGSSLGNALNPMNQLRAYDIQQQMWLRRQQVEQLQRENVAKQAAIQQWSHIVPAERLPQIAAMIYQGAPYDQVARAAAEASGQLIDKTDPASTQANIKFMEQVTGQPWKDPYPPYAGEVTGAYIRQLQSQQKGSEAKQTAAGTAAGGGISTTDQKFFPQGLPGSPGNPVGAPAAAAAPPPPPTATTNPTAPYAAPTPVVRPVPGSDAVITGASQGETAPATSASEANLKELTQALTEAQSAKQLLPKLNQLHDLVQLYNAAGPGGQLDAAATKYFADKWGVSVGDKGAAYQAIQQLLNSEIPDIRQKAGIQKLAGPAIKEEQLIIGQPNMPPQTINNIIANEKAAADIAVERGNVAFRARYGQGQDALSMPDYAKQSMDLDNSFQSRTDDYRKQFGAIGTADQQPAPIAQPTVPLGDNTVLDAIHGALGWLTGGSQTPPSQTPPPPVPDANPPEAPVMWDAKTRSVVPVPGGQ